MTHQSNDNFTNMCTNVRCTLAETQHSFRPRETIAVLVFRREVCRRISLILCSWMASIGIWGSTPMGSIKLMFTLFFFNLLRGCLVNTTRSHSALQYTVLHKTILHWNIKANKLNQTQANKLNQSNKQTTTKNKEHEKQTKAKCSLFLFVSFLCFRL